LTLALWKDLQRKQFAQNYVIVGEEEFLRNQTRKLIVENALTADELEFNLSVIDLEETPIEQAVEEMETFPFLGERRVVILQNAMFLTAASAGKSREKVEHQLDRLLNYLQNPADFTIAVFIVPYQKLDERKKITKALLKHSAVFQAKPLNEAELVRWSFDLADQSRVKIDPKASELLVHMTGNNLQSVAGEMEKLSLHVGEGETITEALVEKMVSKTLEQNVFALVDRIVRNQKLEAIQMYRELLVQKEEPIRILAAIARQYRIYAQVKHLSQSGYGVAQIASKLKLNPYPVKLAAQQMGTFTDEYLLQQIDELAEIDFKMKTGQGDKDMQLELFILKS